MLAAPDNSFSCFVKQSSTSGADFADAWLYAVFFGWLSCV
jgi:hypothetical protein